MNGFLTLLGCSSAFEDGAEPERDEQGNFFVSISPKGISPGCAESTLVQRIPTEVAQVQEL
jgi:hypothetical protein